MDLQTKQKIIEKWKNYFPEQQIFFFAAKTFYNMVGNMDKSFLNTCIW